MRVALVESLGELGNTTGKYCRHSLVEPLGLESLAAVAINAGHTAEVFIWRNEELSEIFQTLLEFNPDLLGLSTYTYRIKETLNLGQELKYYLKNLIIVLGGCHVTACPDVVLNPAIDIGIIGEGEATFRELLEKLCEGHNLENIPGSVSANGRLSIGPPRERIHDLDNLPYAVRNPTWLGKSRIDSAIYPTPSQQRSVAAVLASRGCSFSCHFCLSPLIWKHRVVHRDPSAVVDEIQYLKRKYGTNLIYFCDPSFNAVPSFCKAFCEELLERNLGIYWTASCTLSNLNRDLIELMSRSGCTRLAFGIESIDSSTRKRIKPQLLLSDHEIKAKLSMVRDYGILVRGFFMLGYPWETIEALNRLTEHLSKWPIDDLRMAFLTPFPGTILHRKLMQNSRYAIAPDLNLYTGDNPVCRVQGLNKEDLIEARSSIVKNFYLCREYERRASRMVNAYPHLSRAYEELFEIRVQKEVI